MDMIVRAFPLREGKEESLRALTDQLRADKGREARSFYERFGVARETWHVQTTPQGTWVICATRIGPQKPVEAIASSFATSTDAFDRWFKQQVENLTGINPDVEPLGPATECIFDTDELPTG